MSTDTSWIELGYNDRNGAFAIPCAKDFIPDYPGFRILWTRDVFGTYTLHLTCIGMPGSIQFPVRGFYKSEMCPPANLVRASEARLLAAGTFLFA